jgi:hypothetical protein
MQPLKYAAFEIHKLYTNLVKEMFAERFTQIPNHENVKK